MINDHIREILTQTGGNISYEDLRSPVDSDRNIQSNRTVEAFVHGNLEPNSITIGQGAGLIKDIPSCRELIQQIAGDIDGLLKRLNALYRF